MKRNSSRTSWRSSGAKIATIGKRLTMRIKQNTVCALGIAFRCLLHLRMGTVTRERGETDEHWRNMDRMHFHCTNPHWHGSRARGEVYGDKKYMHPDEEACVLYDGKEEERYDEG